VKILLCGSRRWSHYIFDNLTHMALTNRWIVYKHVCNSSISPRMFITEGECRTNGDTPNKKLQIAINSAFAECAPTPKIAKLVLAKIDRKTYICVICKKSVRGKCQTKQCQASTTWQQQFRVFPASLLVFWHFSFLFCLILLQYDTICNFSSQLTAEFSALLTKQRVRQLTRLVILGSCEFR